MAIKQVTLSGVDSEGITVTVETAGGDEVVKIRAFPIKADGSLMNNGEFKTWLKDKLNLLLVPTLRRGTSMETLKKHIGRTFNLNLLIE